MSGYDNLLNACECRLDVEMRAGLKRGGLPVFGHEGEDSGFRVRNVEL